MATGQVYSTEANDVHSSEVTEGDDEERRKRVTLLLLSLKKEGTKIPGDCGRDPLEFPEWMDQGKLDRAHQLFKRHLFGLFFCALSGLCTLVYVKSILNPLLETKQSASVALLFKRYLSTLTHVKTWCDGKISDPEDKGYVSIQQVRKIHKKVADRLNERIPVGEDLSLSQYDMLITQFAFVGLAVIRPQKFGVNLSQEDLQCVLHFWRLVGYLLGIEEKYNLFTRPHEEMVQMCHAILELEMKESLKYDNRTPASVEMSQGIIESIRPYIPLIKWDAFYRYLSSILDIEDKDVKLDSVRSRLVYSSMQFTLQHVLRSSVLASPLNYLLRRAIKSAHDQKSEIYKHLGEKYPHYSHLRLDQTDVSRSL